MVEETGTLVIDSKFIIDKDYRDRGRPENQGEPIQIVLVHKVQLFWEGHKNLRNLPYGFAK